MDIRQLLEAIMQSRQNNPQAWSGGNRSKDPNFVPNTGLPEPLNPRHLATGPLGGWGNDVSRTGGYNPPVQPATPRPNRPGPPPSNGFMGNTGGGPVPQPVGRPRQPAAPGPGRPVPQPAAGGGPSRPTYSDGSPMPTPGSLMQMDGRRLRDGTLVGRDDPRFKGPEQTTDRQPTGGVNARMNSLKRRVYEDMMKRGGWR